MHAFFDCGAKLKKYMNNRRDETTYRVDGKVRKCIRMGFFFRYAEGKSERTGKTF